FSRSVEKIEKIGEIGPIDIVTFEAVTFRAIHQIVTGKLAVVRRGIRVMIVRGHNDKRHLLHRGDVQSFMGRPRLHAAFTNASQPDKILFAFEALGHERSDRDRDHRAKMTDHCELAVARTATMNVAVASAHWALSRT